LILKAVPCTILEHL